MVNVAYDNKPITTAYICEIIKPNRLALSKTSVAKIIISNPNDKGCRQLNGKTDLDSILCQI